MRITMDGIEHKFDIWNMDCANGLSYISNESIDFVLTSPPYDNLRKYGDTENGWCFSKFKKIANEIYRVLKDGKVCVWIVNDETINGGKSGTSFQQALYFKEIGFRINDVMIWKKKNPMPQLRQPRYRQVFEYMFVFSKGKPNVFNPIMVECSCAGKKYNSNCKNIGGENGRTKKNFTINNKRVDDNIWEIAVAKNKTIHPAVFPKELAIRHIKSWTNEGEIVLDPFMGSGTTAIACLELARNYIGFEINKSYFNESVNRIFESKRQLNLNF